MKALISTAQAAKMFGVNSARVRVLCQEGRIIGAQKEGKLWLIPFGAKIVESANPRPSKIKTVKAKKVKA